MTQLIGFDGVHVLVHVTELPAPAIIAGCQVLSPHPSGALATRTSTEETAPSVSIAVPEIVNGVPEDTIWFVVGLEITTTGAWFGLEAAEIVIDAVQVVRGISVSEFTSVMVTVFGVVDSAPALYLHRKVVGVTVVAVPPLPQLVSETDPPGARPETVKV
jgi:hypothetical protein